MEKQLSEKIALVTGGSRGLGREICLMLANAGAYVIVNYAHNSEEAGKTVEQIHSCGGQAISIRADITNEKEVEALIEESSQLSHGTIDIVVNNATGPQPEASLEETTWEMYADQLQFFVKAPLLVTKAVLKGMKSKGTGRIINIGSDVVQLGNAHFSNYVTAKSAMVGMTRSWASELGPYGITVNIVAPGFTPVERHEGTDQSILDQHMDSIPLRRMGKPMDIAQAVVFLASNESSFITGQYLSVNGGKTYGI
jgi:3-oxoacyl-[acyl-carrier protein] reductase